LNACWGTGLSPLARGTLSDVMEDWVADRFIPAGAGNTKGGSGTEPRYTVYPRWRGEHKHICVLVNTPPGLSPLARGTQLVQFNQEMADRFIPAGLS